jgi:hypothetical protein
MMRKFSFPRKFSRKWERFCVKHLQNDKFKRKFDHFSACPCCCCQICFEAPSGLNNFEVHGQYSCPICFEAPSGVDNREVHVHYFCPICFEAPSGFDMLRCFAKIFIIFVSFRELISRKAKINFRKIFAKIRKRKFSFQP